MRRISNVPSINNENDPVTSGEMTSTNPAQQLTALTGIRFFAVFHIFLHHLWSTRYETDLTKGQFAGMYEQLDALPAWLNNILAHGYLSTSFFFLLSGFILAYLYWTPGGELALTRKVFWWSRFSRVYPAHLIVLALTLVLTLPRFFFDPQAPSIPLAIASALSTATLTHAWVPPFVPIFSWPTWALSAIVFLYLLMPWLMRWLARLTRTQMIALIAAMPLISLLPTLVFLQFIPDGGEHNIHWQIFIGSTPLFWVPHFAAGMLVSRIFGISRFEHAWREKPKRWWAFGDLALIALIAISITDPQELPIRHVLRHGLLMPLYLLVIHDFALGRGFFARLFSMRGMDFLGQLSFSIFIWQNLLMMISFIVVFTNPAGAPAAIWIALIGLLAISILSTRFIEKPLAARLRGRMLERQSVPGPAAAGVSQGV